MPEFILQLDTERVEFASDSLGEEPCTNVVKIKNPEKEKYMFKIKCTSNELFRIQPPFGFIKPGDTESIKLSFDAGFSVPEKIRHCFFVYQRKAEGETGPARSAWGDKEPEGEKRLYIDFLKKEFLLQLDTEKVEFASEKLGEETVTSIVKIKNTQKDKYLYKIKCTSNELFRIRPPLGYIKPGDSKPVKLMFNAGKPVPESGMHSFFVYYRKADGDAAAKSAWSGQEPEASKILLIDFVNKKKEEKKEEAAPAAAAPAAEAAATPAADEKAKDNKAGTITARQLQEQVSNLDDTVYVPTVMNGQLYFVSMNDDTRTARPARDSSLTRTARAASSKSTSAEQLHTANDGALDNCSLTLAELQEILGLEAVQAVLKKFKENPSAFMTRAASRSTSSADSMPEEGVLTALEIADGDMRSRASPATSMAAYFNTAVSDHPTALAGGRSRVNSLCSPRSYNPLSDDTSTACNIGSPYKATADMRSRAQPASSNERTDNVMTSTTKTARYGDKYGPVGNDMRSRAQPASSCERTAEAKTSSTNTALFGDKYGPVGGDMRSRVIPTSSVERTATEPSDMTTAKASKSIEKILSSLLSEVTALNDGEINDDATTAVASGSDQ